MLGKMYIPKGPALETAQQVLQAKFPKAINVAWGCKNQCAGCYIPYTEPGKIRLPQKDPAHMFLGDIARGNRPEGIFLCFATDPFLNCNKETSRKIVHYAINNDIPVATLSKIDVAGLTGVHHKAMNGMTIVSLDKKYWKKYEPYAKDPNVRLSILEDLSNAGEKTWISAEPYRTQEKVKQDMSAFLEKLKFVDFIIFGKQNYDKPSNTPEARQFYEESMNTFVDFCKSNSIRHWVKSGTRYFVETGKVIEKKT